MRRRAQRPDRGLKASHKELNEVNGLAWLFEKKEARIEIFVGNDSNNGELACAPNESYNNAFLPTFRDDYNRCFGRPARLERSDRG